MSGFKLYTSICKRPMMTTVSYRIGLARGSTVYLKAWVFFPSCWSPDPRTCSPSCSSPLLVSVFIEGSSAAASSLLLMSLFSELLSPDTVVLPHTCSNEHLPLNRYSLEFLAFLFPIVCLPNNQVKAVFLPHLLCLLILHLGVVLWARILKKELPGRAELVVQFLCFHFCKCWLQSSP